MHFGRTRAGGAQPVDAEGEAYRRPGLVPRASFIAIVAMLWTMAAPCFAYQQEVRGAVRSIVESLSARGTKSIAVVDFTDLQGNVTELGRFLAEQMSLALAVEAKDISVVDRTHLKALIEEHKLSASGLMDPQTARKLGLIAQVGALATGSLTPIGEVVNLSVKVLDTETARLLAVATADIPRTRAIEDLLARGISADNSASHLARPDADTTTPVAGARQEQPSREHGGAASSAGAVSGAIADFVVMIQSCRRPDETSVTCEGSVTNRAPHRR